MWPSIRSVATDVPSWSHCERTHLYKFKLTPNKEHFHCTEFNSLFLGGSRGMNNINSTRVVPFYKLLIFALQPHFSPSWLVLTSTADSPDLCLPEWFLFYGGWHEVIPYCVMYWFFFQSLFLESPCGLEHKSSANDLWGKYFIYYSWRMVTYSIAPINLNTVRSMMRVILWDWRAFSSFLMYRLCSALAFMA